MKTPRLLISLLLYNCITLFSVYANNDLSNYNIKIIDNENGLPSIEIRRVIQDSDGFMWFASTNGLFRYDGHEIKTYKTGSRHSKEISNNEIHSLADDSLRLWIGTDSGLNYIEKQTQKAHIINNSTLLNLAINKVVTADSSLWLATNKGSYRYNINTDSTYKLPLIINNKAITSYDAKDIYIDSKKQIWIAIKSHGLFKYNKETDRLISYNVTNSKDFAHVIYEDRDNNLWVGSILHGLTLLTNTDTPEETKFKHFKNNTKDKNSIASNSIFSITQDKQNGTLWIGHIDGVSTLKPPFNDGNFSNYKYNGTSNSISNNSVSSVHYGNDGIIWLGTMGGGVTQLNPKSSKLEYNPLKYISKNYHNRFVTAAYKGKDNILWLGLKNNGLFLYDSVKKVYKHSSEIAGLQKIPNTARIKSIESTAGGKEIWLGISEGGLIRVILNANGDPVDCKFSLQNITINKIFTDSKGNIWIGTGNGVTVFSKSGEIIDRKTLAYKDRITQVRSITEDKDGYIWIGSRLNGIFKLELKGEKIEVEQYTRKKNAIQNNNILSVFVDNKNEIWAGTEGGGLNRLNRATNTFESTNNQYKISFDDIFNIFQDSTNTIWMCSQNALINLTTESDQAYIYKASTGLWNNVFNPECEVLELGDDRYLLGGFKGYNILHPKLLNASNKIPSLSITDISVDGVSIFEQDNKEENYSYKDSQLTLDHNNNNFSIQFIAHNYKNSNHNSYAYRLVGYDDKWSYMKGDQREVNFTNMVRGDYLFQVITTNENGVWNSKSVDIMITVLPSPFKTWWAKVIYVLLAFMLIVSSYVIVINRLKLKHRLKIAEIEKKNIELLNHNNLMFHTNISHELLTPLTIIECAAGDLKSNDKNDSTSVDIISNNVDRLVRLITQMLNFRKAESYKLKLHVTNGNISKFIHDTCEVNFRTLAESRGIKLGISSTDDNITGWFDVDKIDSIIYNLLSNAIKYNYDNSFIDVSISESTDNGHRYATITVEDGGIGISPQNIKHIFERFYTEGGVSKEVSTSNGIGLSLSKSLVEIHNGDIRLESVLGKGTKFIITLPIDEQSYDRDQIYSDPKEIFGIDNEGLNIATLEQRDSTILIVEDNFELRTLMAKSLSAIYNVHTADDGEEAITLLEKIEFDLIISDIVMPKKNGIELCKFVKSNVSYSHIPVILLTAKTTEGDKALSYKTGADAFITKPFKLNLLVLRVDNLIKGRTILKEKFKNGENLVQLKDITYTSLDEKILKKAVDIVEANINNEDFKFDVFVSEMGVSKSMLYRKIKSLTGMTTSDFIKDIRLKYACKLLNDKPVSISEVAYAVGFSQPKYFTVCFQKKYGLTPSEYINNQKNGIS